VGRTIGTPAFMAPEQCSGNADIDGRADVYALGAVLYRCLVGRTPFSGTTTQVLHAHVYEQLLIPNDVADVLPASVTQLLARAMMKEPERRFANIGMMAVELKQVAALPVEEMGAQDGAIVDSTVTMDSLPAAKAPTTSTSRVLVPAPTPMVTPAAARPGPIRPVLRASVPLATPVRAISASSSQGRTRARQSRWVKLALAGASAVLVALLVGMLVNSVWPGVGVDDPVLSEATATPAAVAAAGTPQLPPVAQDRPAADVTAEAAQTAQATRPTAQPTPGSPTPTPGPPILALQPNWELAVASYEEGEWQEAVDFLSLVDTTIEGWDLPGEEDIDQQRLHDMWVTSYLGLATNAAALGGWERALTNMEKAAALVPDDALLAEMVANLEALVALENKIDEDSEEQRATLRTDYAALQAAYARQLADEAKVCDALIHVGYAIRIEATEALQASQDQLTAQCRNENAIEGIVETGGTILYSAVAGDTFNIYRMPVAEGAGTALPSALVMGNAAQPRLSPNGSLLAYYSRQHGNDGLSGVRVNGLAPAGGGERYSPNPEDSRDSPPSWESSNARLAYNTGFADQAARIFITSASADMGATDMGYGKDPAWRPNSDVIVFNGPDDTGQNVGFQWMTPNNNGADRRSLTSNGNDQRPVWTSDGKYIVFMSKDRQGGSSWEVYRMEWATGNVVLLTDGNLAQDGLPAISPDNKWVAFMSDRAGRWDLYYVSIDGGEVHYLSPISGQPLSWLEHSIQWVR
jgi:Tol biopolymer transport system component